MICPIHGEVAARLEWCRSDGKLHLGYRCPCGLWLRWMPHDTPGAPIPVKVEPFGVRVPA